MFRSQAEYIEKLFYAFFIISLFLFFYYQIQNAYQQIISNITKEKEMMYLYVILSAIEISNKTNVTITLNFPEKLLFYNNSLILTEIYPLNAKVLVSATDKITIKREGNKIIII